MILHSTHSGIRIIIHSCNTNILRGNNLVKQCKKICVHETTQTLQKYPTLSDRWNALHASVIHFNFVRR